MPRIEYRDFEDLPSVYEYNYPNDFELINIFTEAKEIIPLKLEEWQREKHHILKTETFPYFKKCKFLSGAFKQAFWKEIYHYMADAYNYIDKQCIRLGRLQSIINDPQGYTLSTARIALAKQTPIISIYNFARRGKSYLCPIHNDRDPSFHIYPDNKWHCFGCNKGGDAIDFVQYMFGVSFHEAINYIIGNAGPVTGKEDV